MKHSAGARSRADVHQNEGSRLAPAASFALKLRSRRAYGVICVA